MGLRELLPPYDLDDLDARDPAVVRAWADRFEPLAERWFAPEVRGLERVPSGAGLYVGNHSGGLLTPDTFIFCIALLRAYGVDAIPHGLAHEVALGMPVLFQLLSKFGAVRANAENAHALFAAGRKVLVYPGGDLDAMRAFRDRDRIIFGPRRGYIRLALREGVPIIPVVATGGHQTYVVLDDGAWLAKALGFDRRLRVKVWPISLSLPWGLSVGPAPPHLPLPSKILVEVLDPIRFERTGPEAAEDPAYVEDCHERVLTTMQGTHARLAEERRAGGRLTHLWRGRERRGRAG